MTFDPTAYDDALEAFYTAAKRLLRKNASTDETKRTERECDLLNNYNELVLLTEQVVYTNDKQLIATVQKRTYEAKDKLKECSEVLLEKIIIPDNINDLISFENPNRSSLGSEDSPEVHYSLQEWIDRQYELHTKKDVPVKPIVHTDNNKSDLNLNKNSTDKNKKFNSHPTNQGGNKSIMDVPAFASLMAANIRHNFSGDPLRLAPFLASISYLQEFATSDQLKTLLRKFILTKLEGKASEVVPVDVQTIDDIVTNLNSKIKPENAKVIEGRMMALRTNRSNLQEFSKQVEELSDALRRALINAKMPSELAETEVIEKAIDLCRSNTQNITVKSVLASTKFDSPKDVVAKFIVECNKTSQEAQILSLRQFNKNNRGRNFSNSNQQGGNRTNGRFANNGNRQYNNNGNRQYNNGNRQYNNNNGNNNGNYNRQNQNNNSNQGGSNHGRGGGYRNNNRGSHQNHNVRVAENRTATQSTLGSAEE